MNTNANLHCFEQITFNKWNWEQIIMETAEFTIFNNELRFHLWSEPARPKTTERSRKVN